MSVAGRMMSKRVMGKASFCNIQDLKGNIQSYVARDSVGEENYKEFKKLDVGDVIGVELSLIHIFPCQPVSEKTGNTIVVLSSDCMGEGDEVLGRALMKGFIYALTSQEELPDTVIMYNRGARLPVEGSESLEDLKLLESQGVEILTCGTCLNHYGLTEKLSVGSVTNMYVICEKMLQAEKVVKP